MLKLCHVFAGGQLIATFEPESTWACLIQNDTFLAGIYNFGQKAFGGLFGNGRAPISLILMCAFAGLACGLYYNRKRLWLQYGFMENRVENRGRKTGKTGDSYLYFY
jgi:hypothetical protein